MVTAAILVVIGTAVGITSAVWQPVAGAGLAASPAGMNTTHTQGTAAQVVAGALKSIAAVRSVRLIGHGDVFGSWSSLDLEEFSSNEFYDVLTAPGTYMSIAYIGHTGYLKADTAYYESLGNPVTVSHVLGARWVVLPRSIEYDFTSFYWDNMSISALRSALLDLQDHSSWTTLDGLRVVSVVLAKDDLGDGGTLYLDPTGPDYPLQLDQDGAVITFDDWNELSVPPAPKALPSWNFEDYGDLAPAGGSNTETPTQLLAAVETTAGSASSVTVNIDIEPAGVQVRLVGFANGDSEATYRARGRVIASLIEVRRDLYVNAGVPLYLAQGVPASIARRLTRIWVVNPPISREVRQFLNPLAMFNAGTGGPIRMGRAGEVHGRPALSLMDSIGDTIWVTRSRPSYPLEVINRLPEGETATALFSQWDKGKPPAVPRHAVPYSSFTPTIA